METVFYCSNFGVTFNDFILYVMVRNMCWLYCLLFLFCVIVLKVVKLQVIRTVLNKNILILVHKMFQHISLRLSRPINRLFTY